MTIEALKIFGQHLLTNAAKRKKSLSHDRVAECEEEIADAITKTIADVKRLGLVEAPACSFADRHDSKTVANGSA